MFVKHFVRFNTRDELDDYDVIDFFDIVQSVVPAKVVQAVSVDGNKVSADVLIYDDEDADGPIYIHEIILEEMINMGIAVDCIPTPKPAMIFVAGPVIDCFTIEFTGPVPVPV